MAKVKVKTHSGAKKRFKLTKNGKVKYSTQIKDTDLLRRIQRERELLVMQVFAIQQTHLQ